MREETRALRQAQIEQAAYQVLEEKGYAASSMLAIARKAKASNETLYRWYGDKQGLFKALVERNALQVKSLLEDGLNSAQDPLQTLELLGPKLLELLTGPRSIALNRAAATDPTGELGEAIGRAGRETVAPLISRVLEEARRRELLDFDDTAAAADLYISLLVGDLQIRIVIGREAPPPDQAINARAHKALVHLRRILRKDG